MQSARSVDPLSEHASSSAVVRSGLLQSDSGAGRQHSSSAPPPPPLASPALKTHLCPLPLAGPGSLHRQQVAAPQGAHPGAEEREGKRGRGREREGERGREGERERERERESEREREREGKGGSQRHWNAKRKQQWTWTWREGTSEGELRIPPPCTLAVCNPLVDGTHNIAHITDGLQPT